MVAKAIEFKAEGFGLVRTERMFNAKIGYRSSRG